MLGIPTLIPDSLADRLSGWLSEGPVDTIWQAFVFVVAVVVAAALAVTHPVGVVFAFIILYFLFREPIQDALADVWDRDFWEY